MSDERPPRIRTLESYPNRARPVELGFQHFLRSKNITLSGAQWNIALAVIDLARSDAPSSQFLRSRASGKTFLFKLLEEFFQQCK